jgi:hypothetical protein
VSLMEAICTRLLHQVGRGAASRLADKSVSQSSVEEMFELIDLSDD